MVEGTITTAPDANSPTILFEGAETPSGAYSVLTDAVVSARFQDGWVQIDTEDIPPHTTIGEATYDEDSEKVTALSIREHILEEYGHQE